MVFGWIAWAVIGVLVAFGAYVRLAPSDPTRWHRMPAHIEARDGSNSALRVAQTGPEGLARLDRIARGWPRTEVLAGSVGEGMVTYVSRTAVWGFPDYTTARQAGETLELFGRSRFGSNDFGKNRERVEAWLAEL